MIVKKCEGGLRLETLSGEEVFLTLEEARMVAKEVDKSYFLEDLEDVLSSDLEMREEQTDKLLADDSVVDAIYDGYLDIKSEDGIWRENISDAVKIVIEME